MKLILNDKKQRGFFIATLSGYVHFKIEND